MTESQGAQLPENPPSAGQESPVWLLSKALVKSVAASVPVAASLGQAYSEWEAHKLGERLEELRENITAELIALRERVDDLDERLRESAKDFPALLEITVEKVRREANEGKRRLYAHMLCGTLARGASVPTEDKVGSIQRLETLTSQDLAFLIALAEKEGQWLRDLSPPELGHDGEPESLSEALITSVSKLEAAGLLTGPRRGGGTFVKNRHSDRPTNWFRHGTPGPSLAHACGQTVGCGSERRWGFGEAGMTEAATIVQRLWNSCNVLRDEGGSVGQLEVTDCDVKRNGKKRA